ncbi:RNB domain-containing ribonuclease [Lyngbya confervoides]|uniref:RNB domain-containing ribonuclease n=1 Tax=Lyngbya confervoides BDU141951 TaxID=1574623 RepID=A0ABD4T908_9CYAN|nr:RNB domain-containing ribonuclease [Lyngbya confervoides]MCM1984807.1 RNB domain-containing ribonuclease [Lyngbya confervoides BDU141951]
MRKHFFSRSALDQAKQIAFAPDLWNRPQFPGLTIDGPESRDLDDAIWVQDHPQGVVISVHIADVSEFIPLDSPLDRAAIARTQTRYLKQGSDPMLPKLLSENRLSLLAQQPRPTLTVNITLNVHAQIQAVQVLESWVQSLDQMAYAQVDRILNQPTSPFYSFFHTCLTWADRLYQQRTDPEQRRNPDMPAGAWLDENGTWIISEGSRYHAYRIIQEFMILANRAIAHWLAQRGSPALYRNHIPNTEIFDPASLFAQLRQQNWSGDLHRQLQCDLCRAEYQVQPVGHFALKLSAYCHFTSPIRRLADLINHRIVKAQLKHQPLPYSTQALTKLCEQIEAVNQAQADETKAYFKTQHLARFEAQLNQPQPLESIEDREFSRLLRHAITTHQLSALTGLVEQRLAQGHLSVEDQFVVLLLGQDRSLKDRVFQKLTQQVCDAPSIISIAQTQLETWERSEYVQMNNESPFAVWLEVTLEGQRWTTAQGSFAQRKQQARHQACLIWLQAYVENQLVPPEARCWEHLAVPVAQTVPTVLPPASPQQNAVSWLNELCQKFQWDSPSYSFLTEENGFLCECQVEAAQEIVLGFGSGSRKSLAKQAAADQALQQLYAAHCADKSTAPSPSAR